MVDLATETNADGRIEVFGITPEGAIAHKWQLKPGTSWSHWSRIDGKLAHVAIARSYDGRLELFGTTSARTTFHRSQVSAGGDWIPWSHFNGRFTDLAAQTNADGRIEVFGIGVHGTVWHKSQTVAGVRGRRGCSRTATCARSDPGEGVAAGIAANNLGPACRRRSGQLSSLGSRATSACWFRGSAMTAAAAYSRWATDGIEQLDVHETTGLSYRDGRLGRLLRAPGERTAVAELVISDGRGATEYRRLDEVSDPHDILASDAGWIVVSTLTNEIVEIGAAAPRLIWKGASAAPDAWHINCLTVAEGDLWASAFGRFDSFKGWRGTHGLRTGFLRNLRTGEEIAGLSHPHTPRWIDGSWIVCESILSTVVRRDRAGGVVASCDAGGYTRGLAHIGDTLLVGVSTRRSEEAGSGNASVVAIALDRFEVVARIPLPCLEIYDLCVVPATIVEGVRVGFATNAYRVSRGRAGLLDGGAAEHGGRTESTEIGDWLDPARCSCRVAAEIREQTRAETSRGRSKPKSGTRARRGLRVSSPIPCSWRRGGSRPTDRSVTATESRCRGFSRRASRCA